jgi:hypothetical protein
MLAAQLAQARLVAFQLWRALRVSVRRSAAAVVKRVHKLALEVTIDDDKIRH